MDPNDLDGRAALKRYHDTLYPWEALVSLLSLNGTLESREVKVIDVDSVWALHDGRRWYRDAQELRAFVNAYKGGRPRQLLEMHIGATYTGTPRQGLLTSAPLANELVFDIDVNDYEFLFPDPQKIAQADFDRCFPIVAFGMQLLTDLLVDKGTEHTPFAYRHVLGFNSGRRGAHLWVLDRAAAELSNDGRRAVLAMVTLDRDPETGAMAAGMHAHPNASHAFARCRAFFEEWVLRPKAEGGGGLFDTEQGLLDFYHTMAGLGGVSRLEGVAERAFWEATPQLRFRKLAEATAREGVPAWCSDKLDRAVIGCVWPRADEAVTAQMGHARKAPWTVHKKTGRICEPVFDGEWDAYRPEDAPTLTSLLDATHPRHAAHAARFRARVAMLEETVARASAPRGTRAPGAAVHPGVHHEVPTGAELADGVPLPEAEVVVVPDVEDLGPATPVVDSVAVEAPAPAPASAPARVEPVTVRQWLELRENCWTRKLIRTFYGQNVPGVGVRLGSTLTALSAGAAELRCKGAPLDYVERDAFEDDRVPKRVHRLTRQFMAAPHGQWVRIHREPVVGLVPQRFAPTEAEAYTCFDAVGRVPVGLGAGPNRTLAFPEPFPTAPIPYGQTPYTAGEPVQVFLSRVAYQLRTYGGCGVHML